MTPADAWQVTVAVLTSLGGGSVIVWSASSYLGKIWAARILERDRAHYAEALEGLRSSYQKQQQLLQSELERAVKINHVQFETEYKGLIDVWEKLALLRGAMAKLPRSGPAMAPAKETEAERLEREANDFRGFLGALNALVVAVDTQSPFYPPEVFAAVDEARMIAREVETEFSLAPEYVPNRMKRSRELWERFQPSCERVATSIREYLQKARVAR